jgi:hypothetical protein
VEEDHDGEGLGDVFRCVDVDEEAVLAAGYLVVTAEGVALDADGRVEEGLEGAAPGLLLLGGLKWNVKGCSGLDLK